METKETNLDVIECRVLGVLLEKEQTTPDYYPMTLNQLRTACNQKTSRNPVMSLEESDVVRALDQLQRKLLAGTVTGAGSRVTKYRHNAPITLSLDAPEAAVLCLLLLRGAQTVGEIKSNSGRIYGFESLEETQEVLTRLIDREKALVVELPKRPGRKEPRYMHLLAGEPQEEDGFDSDTEGPAVIVYSDETERINRLEAELEALRTEFNQFKQQF